MQIKQEPTEMYCQDPRESKLVGRAVISPIRWVGQDQLAGKENLEPQRDTQNSFTKQNLMKATDNIEKNKSLAKPVVYNDEDKPDTVRVIASSLSSLSLGRQLKEELIPAKPPQVYHIIYSSRFFFKKIFN